jgi:hypothetical protein
MTIQCLYLKNEAIISYRIISAQGITHAKQLLEKNQYSQISEHVEL